MHSSCELTSDQFEVTIQGSLARIDDILPGFGEQSRLGVIVRDDFGALGASTLITAAVTRFYDIQRDLCPDGFYRYPDYYLFHAGRFHGSHSMLDVFPAHKEVMVHDDPESLLRAINDRSITHLVVPEGRPREVDFHPETLNGAKHRIHSAVLYSSGGSVGQADIEIKGNEHVDSYVRATLEAPEPRSRLDDEIDGEIADAISAERERLKVGGRTVESFRRTSIDQALCLLSPNPVPEFSR